MAISLRTPRLFLHEWRDADCEPFAAISADPEVRAMLPQLPDRAERRLDRGDMRPLGRAWLWSAGDRKYRVERS